MSEKSFAAFLALTSYVLLGCATINSLRPGSGTTFKVENKTYNQVWKAAVTVVNNNFKIVEIDKNSGIIKAEKGASFESWGEVVGIFINTANENHFTVEVISKKKDKLQITGQNWESTIVEAMKVELDIMTEEEKKAAYEQEVNKSSRDDLDKKNILSINLSHTLLIGGLDLGIEHVLNKYSTIGLRTVWFNGSLPGQKEESTIEGISLSATYKYYLNKDKIEGVWIGPNILGQSTTQKYKKISGCEAEISAIAIGPAIGYSWLLQDQIFFSIDSIYRLSEMKNKISGNCQGKVIIEKTNPFVLELGVGFLF